MATLLVNRSNGTRNTNEVSPKTERTIVPATDLFVTASGWALVLDLPGATPENLSLDVEDGTLTIEAVTPSRQETGRALHTEFHAGTARRQFSLSDDIDTTAITAELANGVLTVRLPKAAKATPKKVEVKLG